MAISYAFLGMLFLLDAFFFGNYVVIHALRLLANAQSAMDEEDGSAESGKSRNEDDASSGECSESDEDDNRGEHYSPWTKVKGCGMVSMALFLDVVTKEPLSTRSFPKWRVLYVGVISTSILLMISTVFLSTEAMINVVADHSPETDSSQHFCVTDDFDAKIATLKEEIYGSTQIELARKQFEHTVGFHLALVNDTTLYGSGEYVCPDILDDDGSVALSGNKLDWADRSVPPASQNGGFFPGYCGAALQAAITAAKETKCVDKICKCPNIPQIYGPPINTCLGGIARMCVDIPVACPKHTQDQEATLRDYRMEQLRLAEAEREAQFEDSEFPVDIPEELLTAAATTTKKILFQVDVASSVYVGYSILSLFFPAPLVLFRPRLRELLRIYLFGVHKLTFILLVVCIWWGIEYFRKVLLSPEVRLYLRNLRDPCFLDGDYVISRQQVLNEVCKDLVPMEGAWATSIVTIQHVLVEVSHFIHTCSCSFPIVDLGNFRTPKDITVAQADAIGFGNRIDGIPFILTPKDTQQFVGDSSICNDSELAKKIVMETSEAGANWWELWVATGLLARILIKVSVCNFGVALYRLADPLSICAGRYEWPSNRFTLGRSTSTALEQVKREKTVVYWWVALKSAVFWGLLAHICLINLVLTAWRAGGVPELRTDAIVGIVFFAIALFSIPIGWFVSTNIDMRRLKLEKQAQTRKVDSENPVTMGADAQAVTIRPPDGDEVEVEHH